MMELESLTHESGNETKSNKMCNTQIKNLCIYEEFFPKITWKLTGHTNLAAVQAYLEQRKHTNYSFTNIKADMNDHFQTYD